MLLFYQLRNDRPTSLHSFQGILDLENMPIGTEDWLQDSC